MGVKKQVVASASAAVTRDLVDELQKKVSAHAPRSSIDHAMTLRGESRATRVSRLYELVSGGTAERMARVLDIMDTLRRELPEILSGLPLKLGHLGFSRLEELVEHIGRALMYMETSASSKAEFARGLEGWRWNLVGRVLFERLVKNHPALSGFFQRLAGDLIGLANQEIVAGRRTMVDIHGKRPHISASFRTPVKVIEFRLKGADGVERAFTDFGFLSTNVEGWQAVLPIELKLPAALSGVAEQFSEFISRLITGEKVIAVVERGGKLVEESVDPARLVFLQHDRAQLAVAPLSMAAAKRLQAKGAPAILPSDVASVVEFEPKASATHEVSYYRIRLLVFREWLEALVRPITDPPRRPPVR